MLRIYAAFRACAMLGGGATRNRLRIVHRAPETQRTVASWTANHHLRDCSLPLATRQQDLGSGGATRGGSSPSSSTSAELLNKSHSSTGSAGDTTAGGDDSVDASAMRAAMVGGLTDSLRRMLIAGDAEGARVALRALDDLVRLIERRGERSAGTDRGESPVGGGTIAQLVDARGRRPRD